MKYNKFIDHTLLKPEATEEDIKRLCAEARKYDFMSVCVNPCFVPLAKELLKGSDVRVCTVIGFPLGANRPALKAEEAKLAVSEGADEVDMVQNVGLVKMGKYNEVEEEIASVRAAASHPTVLKVILETCLLTDEEIVLSSQAAKKAGADFVKTSTGFNKEGATVHAVRLMRKAVGPDMGVKASGGIHTKEQMLALIEAGANRIGASSGVKLIEGDK